MASYTTLVNVDADIATKVCTFVSRLVGAEEGPAYLEVCKDFIEKRQTKQLIAQLLSKAELILDMESNSDVERIFQAILSVIYTLSDETKDTAEIVRSVLVCMSSAETQPSARLAVMVVLFNIIFSTESKCEVLTAMCEYALKTGQAAQVGHMLGKLEGAVAAWDVPVASKRGVLQAFAKVLEAQGESSVALRCLITFFKTFTATGAKISYPSEVEAVISAAVVNAINSPLANFADRSSLLECVGEERCTYSVSARASLGPLLTLLTQLCDGNYAEFAASKGAQGVLAKAGLDVEMLERSLRLLAMCSLAARSTGPADKVLSFELIQSSLGVPADEVEMWVIDAIGEGLIDASIDQLCSTVTINRYAHTSFGMAHWRLLQTQLSSMRSQVAATLETIERNSAPVPAPAVTMT